MKINIDSISNPTACECAVAYEAATDSFEQDPVFADINTQKKICKWMQKYYMSREAFGELFAETDEKMSDSEFLKLAKQCLDKVRMLQEAEKEKFRKYAVNLNEETRNAVEKIVNDTLYFTHFYKEGNNIKIPVDSAPSFTHFLVLENAENVPEVAFHHLWNAEVSFDNESNRYILSGVLDNWDTDTESDFEITFSDAHTEITVMSAVSAFWHESPWDYLIEIAENIIRKYSFSADYLNKKEKDLLPLLAELCKFSVYAHKPEEFNTADFSNLKGYLSKYQYTKALKALSKVEEKYFSKNYLALSSNFVSMLNRQKYEPLWRELFALIADTQKDYPQYAPAFYNEAVLEQARKKIQQLMEANGYTGTYPDFIKTGSLKGIRTVNSYNSPFTVGFEKNVVYHIHCTEQLLEQEISINIVCGTELLKEYENSGDIFSCMFAANGRRLFSTITFNVYDGEKSFVNKTEKIVVTAIKKAELQKLTKQERKEFNKPTPSLVSVFLFCLFVLGLGFGILFTIAMIGFTFLIEIIDGGNTDLLSFIIDELWLKIFLFTSLAFGGAMGIFMVLALKR